MSENDKFLIKDDDVIKLNEGKGKFTGLQSIFSLSEFLVAGANQSKTGNSWWRGEGVAAQVLRPGEKWRTGSIRITLEFIPTPGNDVPPLNTGDSLENFRFDD